MDKSPVIGFVLIIALLMGWMIYNSSQQTPKPADTTTENATSPQTSADDNTSFDPLPGVDEEIVVDAESPVDGSLSRREDPVQFYDSVLQERANGPYRIITIENDLYRIELNSRGAVFKEWTLKNYLNWDREHEVQLIPYDENPGVFGVSFSTRQARNVDTRNLYFDIEHNGNGDHIVLQEGDSLMLTAVLPLSTGGRIVKDFVFRYGTYKVDADVRVEDMSDLIFNRTVNVSWEKGLRYQEQNTVDESSFARAFVVSGGEEIELDAASADEEEDVVKEKSSGTIDYSAIKIKYFTAAMKTRGTVSEDATVYLQGSKRNVERAGLVESYAMSYRMPYRQATAEYNFELYVGPLDYDRVHQFGMERTVDFGWGPIGVIGEYIIMPFFKMVHKFIPNYGVAILVMSLLLKLILSPLSMPQLRNAAKQKLVAPQLAEMREKHKDDMQAQQREQMRIFNEHGISMMPGCLPMLLQMPILYALYMLFQSALDLRQAPFIGWIHDLSRPDVLVDLGFKLPFLGLDHISGLALAMGITMFIQQKMTITDPRQKGIVYIMPLMLTILFSNFPAGLNLYYFVFNLLSIAQQTYITNYSPKRPTLEELRAAPKKKSWLQQKMDDAQAMAAAQGRPIPGQNLDKQFENPNKRKRKRKPKKR